MIGIELLPLSQSAAQRTKLSSGPGADFGMILDLAMSGTEDAAAPEVLKRASEKEVRDDTESEDAVLETAQEGVFPSALILKNTGLESDLRVLAEPGLSLEGDGLPGGDDSFPRVLENDDSASPNTQAGKGTSIDLALQPPAAGMPDNPTGFAPETDAQLTEITPETRNQSMTNANSQVTEHFETAKAKPEIDPLPSNEAQDPAPLDRTLVPSPSHLSEEAIPGPVTLQSGSSTIAASTHYEQAGGPKAKIAGPFSSALAQNVAEQMAQISPETERILIKLKPHGMGLLEMEISREQSGRHDISVRVQNSLVLDALRLDKQAILDLLGGQGAGATLDLNLYQPDPRPKNQSDAEPAAHPSETAEAKGEPEELRRPEIVTLGATNILI